MTRGNDAESKTQLGAGCMESHTQASQPQHRRTCIRHYLDPPVSASFGLPFPQHACHLYRCEDAASTCRIVQRAPQDMRQMQEGSGLTKLIIFSG